MSEPGENPLETLAAGVVRRVTPPGELAGGAVGTVTHPDRMLALAIEVTFGAVSFARSVLEPQSRQPEESDRWDVAPEAEDLAVRRGAAVQEPPEAVEEPPSAVEEPPSAVEEPPAMEEPLVVEEPPAVDELPDTPLPGEPEPHVEVEEELVAEIADSGAEEGAGPEIRIEPPWEGYAAQTADDILERIPHATDEELAVIEL